jgi:hypothetical protein
MEKLKEKAKVRLVGGICNLYVAVARGGESKKMTFHTMDQL